MPLPFLVPAAAAIASQLLPSLIGRLAGDRAERVASEIVSVAAEAAGVPGSGDEHEILGRLQADPKALAEAQIRLREVDRAEMEAELRDRQSARERDVALAESGQGNTRANIMIGFSFAALVACIGLAIFRQLPPEVLSLLTTVIGFLMARLTDVFNFEFGSSRSSKEKTLQIEQAARGFARLAERNGPPTPQRKPER